MGVEELILLIVVGLVAGFSAGLIGIGGGLFYVLVYSYFLDKYDFASEVEYVRMVISNSILSTCFAALSASIKHYRQGNFFPKQVLLIGCAGLVSAIAFTYLISAIPFYNRKTFAVVFTIAVLPLIWKMLTKIRDGEVQLSSISKGKYVGVGLLSGAGTAMSGLGGAFIITPLLNGLFGIHIKKVVSVSVGVIVIVAGGVSLFSLLTQQYSSQVPYTVGGIHFLMVLPIVISVMIAAPLGVKASVKLPSNVIRYLFLLFCIGIIIRNFTEIF